MLLRPQHVGFGDLPNLICHSQKELEDQGYVDNGCSRHMTGNMSYLTDFKEFDGGYVAFRGGAKGGKITGKGTIKTDKLNFKDMYFVKELKFNLFSVLQMCDKKNSVLFTDTECFVLSPNFKLADESQVLLKVPRKNNMYSVDMKNIVLKESLTCLVAKATLDESMLWHRRLGHVNFKTINKLVKENLVKGLPSKSSENDQTCVACLKGKQHKAFCKSKIQNSITQPLFMLHMDLFGLTFVSNLMNKKYCLVVTDDYSRFTWVFILVTKDETSGILKSFITEIETLVDKKIKIIRCDNRTEFKNRVTNEFCKKTRIRGRTPALSFMRPFGCHVTILNTIDHLGKFEGKADEGFFVGYSMNNTSFRVYNIRTKKVKENLYIEFLENKPIIAGDGQKWLFDIDVLTESTNYVPVVIGTNSNDFADGSLLDSSLKKSDDDESQPSSDAEKKVNEGPSKECGIDVQERPKHENSTKDVNTVGPTINTACSNVNTNSPNINIVSPTVNTVRSSGYQTCPDMPTLGDNATLKSTYNDFFSDESDMRNLNKIEVDMSNITNTYLVLSTPNTRIHKDHSFDLPIGKRAIGTKWVFRNKKDERGNVIRNKARLVAQGHRQEEGIYYEKVFAPVARIEAIRLFLAYASFLGFLVYQMDVKSAFLYGTIKEEVYVTQPPGFKDPNNPDKVYKVVKALYGLHQSLRAWYETLANYLLGNGFKRGKVDQILFIKKQKGDILLVQVYVDDIIFGSTNKELLQQKEDGIFIIQDKYVDEILKKFNYTDMKSASTPVDLYLKGKPTLGLWYSRDSPFELVAYTDSDYAGATQDRKSTTGGCQFLGNRLISWQCKKQTVVATSTTEAEYVAAASCCGQCHASQKEVGTLRYLSLVVPLKKVGDEAIHKELGDKMKRAATTSSSLEAEQESGNINKTQSMATLNGSSS
ncbi:retrovirus-related pol polyprotein from transposon TNT 1-94 [Tanacetum coccineum]